MRHRLLAAVVLCTLVTALLTFISIASSPLGKIPGRTHVLFQRAQVGVRMGDVPIGLAALGSTLALTS